MSATKRIFSSAFISICVVTFVLHMGQFMVTTLIPKYSDALSATPSVVGIISSVYAVTSLLCKPVAGPALDFFKKKYVLAFATASITLAFVGYSISTNITMIIISRLIHGFGMATAPISLLTMVSDAVEEKDLTKGVAYYGMVQAVASAIGPTLGLMLADHIGYSMSFLLGAAICLVSFFIALSLKTEMKAPKAKSKFKISLGSAISKKAIVPACIMIFLAGTYNTLSSFLILFADELNISNIGWFFTLKAIALILCRPVIAKLSEKFGEYKILPIAIICFSASMLTVAFSTSLETLLFAAVLNAFGYGACQPLIQALCIKSAPPNRRGAASATCYYGTDIGYLLGPLIFGKIAELFDYSIMFATTIIFTSISLVIFFVFRKSIKALCFESYE